MYANDPEGFKAKQDQAKQMYKQGVDPMSQFGTPPSTPAPVATPAQSNMRST